MGRRLWVGLALGVPALGGCEPGVVGQAPSPPPDPPSAATVPPAAPPPSAPPVETGPRRVDVGVLSVEFPSRPKARTSRNNGLSNVDYDLDREGRCVSLGARLTTTPHRFRTPPGQFIREMMVPGSDAPGTLEGVRVHAADDDSMASARYALVLASGSGAIHSYMVWLPGRSELYTFTVGCQGEGITLEGAAFLGSVRVSEAFQSQAPAPAPPAANGALW